MIRIREFGLELSSANCDKCFISYYTGKQDMETLNHLINQLFDFFNINIRANIIDDYYDIQKMYLGNRKNKSLKHLYSKISKEWDYEKNMNISPEMVLPGSISKYWWKCDKCGFSWQASVNSRTNRNTGCPKCGGSLKLTNDEFLKKMKIINPNIEFLEEYINSEMKIKCKCKICGNVWKASPSKLQQKRGCPVCAINNTKRTAQEYYAKLSEKRPDIICLSEYVDKQTKMLFQCKKCKYIWKAFPDSVLDSKKCRKCNGTTLLTNEEFVLQLNLLNKNIEVLSTYVGANKPIKCKCKKCSFEWLTTPNRLKNGNGCPLCNSSRITNEEFKDKLKNRNPNIEPLEKYIGTFNEIKFHCKKCGYEWVNKPTNVLKNPKCPVCGKKDKKKTDEQFIKELELVNDKVDVLETYKGVHVPISVKCKKCGLVFKKSPHELLKGRGCSNCKSKKE